MPTVDEEEEMAGFVPGPNEAQQIVQIQMEAIKKLQELESNTVTGGEQLNPENEEESQEVSNARKKVCPLIEEFVPSFLMF